MKSFKSYIIDTILDEGIVTDRPTTGVHASPSRPQQFVTKNDLKRLESVLDNLFKTAKLDIAFTQHF